MLYNGALCCRSGAARTSHIGRLIIPTIAITLEAWLTYGPIVIHCKDVVGFANYAPTTNMCLKASICTKNVHLLEMYSLEKT